MKRLLSKPASSSASGGSTVERPTHPRRDLTLNRHRHPSLTSTTPNTTSGSDYPGGGQDQELGFQTPSKLHQNPLDLSDSSPPPDLAVAGGIDHRLRGISSRGASRPDAAEHVESSSSLAHDSLMQSDTEKAWGMEKEKAFLGLVKVRSRDREHPQRQGPTTTLTSFMSFPRSPTTAHNEPPRQRNVLRRKPSANAVLASSASAARARARSLSQSPLPPNTRSVNSNAPPSTSPHTASRTTSLRSHVHRKPPPPLPTPTLIPQNIEASHNSPLHSPQRSPALSASSYTRPVRSPSLPHASSLPAHPQTPLHTHPEDIASFDSRQSSRSSRSNSATTSSHAQQPVNTSSSIVPKHSSSHSKKWSTKEVLGLTRLKVPVRSQSSPNESPSGSVASSRVTSREPSRERDGESPRERQRALTPAGMVMEAYKNRKRVQEAHEAKAESPTVGSSHEMNPLPGGGRTQSLRNPSSPSSSHPTSKSATSPASYLPSVAASLNTPSPLSTAVADDYLSLSLPQSLPISSNFSLSSSPEQEKPFFLPFDAYRRQRSQRPRATSTNTTTTINTTASTSTYDHGSYAASKHSSNYAGGPASSTSSLPPPLPTLSSSTSARATLNRKASHPSKRHAADTLSEGEKEAMPYFTIVGSRSGKVVAVGGPEDSWSDYSLNIPYLTSERRGAADKAKSNHDAGVKHSSGRSFSRDRSEKRNRRPSESHTKHSKATDSEEKDQIRSMGGFGRTITRKVSGKWGRRGVSVEGRSRSDYDDFGSSKGNGGSDREKLKAWDFVSNPSSPMRSAPIMQEQASAEEQGRDLHDERDVFSDGGRGRKGRGRRGSLRLSLERYRSADVEVEGTNESESAEAEERGRSAKPARSEDLPVILTPTMQSASKKLRSRKSEHFDPVTSPGPTQSRHHHSSSSGSKLWKLVKRISTGGLREKYHQDSSDAPPVPALPNDYLQMIQPRQPHNDISPTSAQDSDDARNRFLRSRTSLSAARDSSPQPERRLNRRPSLGVMKNSSPHASSAPATSISSSPNPSLSAKLPLPPPPPIPTTPLSHHQPLSSSSLPSSTKSHTGSSANHNVTPTRSSSPVSSSDVASSRFFHRAQSARSSTSSYGDEPLPFNIGSAPPMPTSLGQHILPPSELYDQVRKLHGKGGDVVVADVAGDLEVRGHPIGKGRPSQADHVGNDDKGKKGKSSPLKLFNRTKSTGAVNPGRSSDETRKLSLDDWTIVRAPSVDSEMPSLPYPPRRPAQLVGTKKQDDVSREPVRGHKGSTPVNSSGEHRKAVPEQGQPSRPSKSSTDPQSQNQSTVLYPSQIPTQSLGPPPPRPSRSAHRPSPVSSNTTSRVTSPVRSHPENTNPSTLGSGVDAFVSSLGLDMGTLGRKSEIGNQLKERKSELEQKKHEVDDRQGGDRKSRYSTSTTRPAKPRSSSVVRPSSASYPERRTSTTSTISPPPAPFAFREMGSLGNNRKTLTEKEKADRWDDLLERSDKAGGTLHFNLGLEEGESGLQLDSDQISVSASELLA
ncbi:hypothetical protein AX16_005814 [Volvariella volvacea WC 439]|nr:hypothetical protein AX16_005814 [Volvariella volvacea WC 439]